MIQKEIKSMIQKTSKDKIALHKLYTNGYFQYSENPNYIGAVATVNSNNKAVISYLQDVNDESKIIATVNFQNGGTLIYGLFGEKYFLRQSGQNLLNMYGFTTSKVYTPGKTGIKQDVDYIRSQCLAASNNAPSLFSKLIIPKKNSPKNLSKTDIKRLLEETLAQLNATQNIWKSQAKDISPKVDVPRLSSESRTSSRNFLSDNIHEI